MGGTSGSSSPLRTPSHAITVSSPGYHGTGGFSYPASRIRTYPAKPVPDPSEKILILSSRMRKIKIKEEKIEPEWTEVKSPSVLERALALKRAFIIAHNSLYGTLGFNVERTKTTSITNRIKPINHGTKRL